MMWSSRILIASPALPRLGLRRSLDASPAAGMGWRRTVATTDVVRGATSSPLVASISNPLSDGHNNSLPFLETRRYMSKYLSKSATKRLPLNTKRAKKGYYKGKGCTSEGRLTSKGKFIADPLKKLQLILPDLEGFPLKPYIANTVSKKPPSGETATVPGS